jgi:single-strand DNA-binding protein
MADSTITIVGGLPRDPELRFTGNGRAVASFSVAVSYRYNQNNEWKEETSYFDVSAWGSLGENAAATLTKGMRVIVSGRLQQRRYETKDGEKRSAVEIVADEIGPSLRWATATVERIQRSDGGQGGARRVVSPGDGAGGTGRVEDLDRCEPEGPDLVLALAQGDGVAFDGPDVPERRRFDRHQGQPDRTPHLGKHLQTGLTNQGRGGFDHADCRILDRDQGMVACP